MLPILYNEKNYVIAVKPRGVLSQSASEATGKVPDMVEMLSEQLHSEIFPIHRLDRETAGVMVYAKNKRAAAAFSTLVAQNALDKRYLAAVMGTPEPAGPAKCATFYIMTHAKTKAMWFHASAPA